METLKFATNASHRRSPANGTIKNVARVPGGSIMCSWPQQLHRSAH